MGLLGGKHLEKGVGIPNVALAPKACLRYLTTLLAVVVGATTAIGKTQSSATFLATVDGAGRLTPIAAFDGQSWSDRWPRATDSPSIANLPLPGSLASIPADWLPPGLKLPIDWRVLRPGGDLIRARALRVERPQPSAVDTFVIRTTFRGDPGASGEYVAISGPGAVGRFVLPRPAEEQNILQQLAPRIADLEATAIDSWRRDGHPNAALTRVYQIVTSEGVHSVTERREGTKDFDLLKAARAVDGRTYYHLDGEKLFWMDSKRECKMNLSSDGIVVTNGEGKVVSERISSHAYAEYCGDRAEWSTPMATLDLGGRYWWIVKVSVEDGYEYLLLDPRTGESIDPW